MDEQCRCGKRIVDDHVCDCFCNPDHVVEKTDFGEVIYSMSKRINVSSERTSWKCVECGRVNAPFMEYCTCSEVGESYLSSVNYSTTGVSYV